MRGEVRRTKFLGPVPVCSRCLCAVYGCHNQIWAGGQARRWHARPPAGLKSGEPPPGATMGHGCQMGIARFLDCLGLALQAWLTMAPLHCKICHLATLAAMTRGRLVCVLSVGHEDDTFSLSLYLFPPSPTAPCLFILSNLGSVVPKSSTLRCMFLLYF